MRVFTLLYGLLLTTICFASSVVEKSPLELASLVADKIIEKSDDPESKSKGYYKLTQRGIDLLPILIEIHLWSEKYFPIPEDIKTILIEVKKDKAEFINRAVEELTND